MSMRKAGRVGIQVSERVGDAGGARESGRFAPAEARPRAIGLHPPGPAGRPRPAPPSSLLSPSLPPRSPGAPAEPPWRSRERTGFLSGSSPAASSLGEEVPALPGTSSRSFCPRCLTPPPLMSFSARLAVLYLGTLLK